MTGDVDPLDNEKERDSVGIAKPVFVDLSRHTVWLVLFLILTGMLAVIGIVSGLAERNILQKIVAGTVAATEDMEALANTSDQRQMYIGLVQLSTAIVQIILFGWWIVRSSRNAHALSRQALKISPGWSLGWFFIPIANIWKPFQAMRQTWNSSENPSGDAERPAPTLIWGWWIMWLISSSVDRAAFRQSIKAESLDELLRANSIVLASDTLALPMNVLAGLLVYRIWTMQKNSFAAQTLRAT